MLEVTTGSRLHFGLLELAEGQPLRFGGLGLMLDSPGWVLRIGGEVESTQGSLSDEVSARIEQVRDRLGQQMGRAFDARIEVLQTLPMHSGLGAGTQLAAAVAAGLTLYSRQAAEPTIDELLQNSGRGKRSGIGLFGFLHGGLILDEGHSPGTVRAVRATSVTLAHQWRVVLITPDQAESVTGGYEASLIEQLGQTLNSDRERMFTLANRTLELASKPDDFEAFANTLQAYLDASGRLFSAGQGGMYNGEAVSHAVALAKECGLKAVGQSSWGPTVFGFAAQQSDAERIATKLTELRPNERWQIRISTPARQGASCRWVEE